MVKRVEHRVEEGYAAVAAAIVFSAGSATISGEVRVFLLRENPSHCDCGDEARKKRISNFSGSFSEEGEGGEKKCNEQQYLRFGSALLSNTIT